MTRPRGTILAAVAAALALAAGAAVPALTARPAASARTVMPTVAAGTTIYACLTSRHALTRVSVGRPLACPRGAIPLQWRGRAGKPVRPPRPRPSPSPSPSPSPTGTPTGTACVTSAHDGTCGAYLYPPITNSNGFDTYVANNCWADPSCRQSVTAHNPGDWSVSADEPLGNRAVKTYPNVQQLFNNWNGHGWNGPGPLTFTPISRLSKLTSSYAETMPHNSVTDSQAAWDIWLGNNGSFGREIMIWVDNVNRDSGGAPRLATATIGGQDWTLYGNPTGELIWSLGAPGTFGQHSSGTVDLLALLKWLQSNRFTAPGAVIGQVDFGWEICSTGGAPETFAVSHYTLRAAAV